MKLLFYQYAERVYKDTLGNYYTSGSFPPEVWERYLCCCDKLIVLMREGNEILTPEFAKKNKQYIDTHKIDLRLMPDKYASVLSYLERDLNYKIDEVQTKAVSECDAAIIRGASSDIIKKLVRANKPYLIEVVGCTWDALRNHGWKGKLMALPSFFCARKEIKRAPWVLYVTEKFLQRRYPTKGKSCACSDVVIEAQPEEVLIDRLKKIDDLKGKIVIGTVGAVNVSYKGQRYIIEAISCLKKRGDTRFIYQLAGGGEQIALKELAEKMDISDQVQFLGSLPHEQIFQWLKQIDIYVQPSLLEGLPRSVIEAMSMGLPIYASAVGGMSELLPEQVLFPKKNVKKISKILSELKQNELRKHAIENFNNAKRYMPDRLNAQRTFFYQQFMKDTGNSGENR